MSNTQQSHVEHVEEHSSPIKTPKQLIVTVLLAFIVPIIIIFMLVNLVVSDNKVGAGSDTLTPEAIATRIAPIARLSLVDASGPKVFKTGEQVFTSVCSGCHKAGVAGAFKFGDAAAWAPSIKTGQDTMIANAIKGKNAMPPKGGNPLLDDFEIARAVTYMANNSGAQFPEPAEPAPAAPAAAK